MLLAVPALCGALMACQGSPTQPRETALAKRPMDGGWRVSGGDG